MSRLAQELAEQLAIDTVDAADKLGDETLTETIAKSVGASSPTTEELFRTAVRTLVAERRARRLLQEKLAVITAPPPS
ncbi:hypothetical protein [Gymnodinialimonas ulvae]|uniref:hypothetical protein n=1 Tax=Gymnodinialimonas ulvae TaxID=3126504 RepID=UPI00309EA66A